MKHQFDGAVVLTTLGTAASVARPAAAQFINDHSAAFTNGNLVGHHVWAQLRAPACFPAMSDSPPGFPNEGVTIMNDGTGWNGAGATP